MTERSKKTAHERNQYESYKRAHIRYVNEKTTKITLNLHNQNDSDLISALDARKAAGESMQAYVKRALRLLIASEGSDQAAHGGDADEK